MEPYRYNKPLTPRLYPPEHLDGLRLKTYQINHPFEPPPLPSPMIQMSLPPILRVDRGSDPMLPWRR